jgi:hypothetical protein
VQANKLGRSGDLDRPRHADLPATRSVLPQQLIHCPGS